MNFASRSPIVKTLAVAGLLFFASLQAKAYSILAHEAIIDASWHDALLPLIQKRYPNLTGPDIKKAHSYAYGGAMVADMGYMPFGNGFFTDLLHYVRSGGFVEALIRDAQNADEYAFALGALSHYLADEYGHSMATNRNIPLIYPKLQQKFGDVVTYADDHKSHSRMEFSYDVLQTGRGSYTSEGYHDFIGFNISVPVLERAFYETYGQPLNSIFGNINGSINQLRWGIRNLFPVLTKSAFKANKDTILKMTPGMTARNFQYKMSKKSFQLEYGKQREKPKFFARVAVFFISILPKIGPLKTLKYVSPGKAGERLFAMSFDTITTRYAAALKRAGNGTLNLPDMDFDTGKPSALGEYPIADDTYDKLLIKLQDNQFKNITPELQQNILRYYRNADTSATALKQRKEWKKASTSLQQIKVLKPGQQEPLKPIENPMGSTE
ncbi:zinc dependent phospholipase C family protein [Mucilaginibacter pedocola]|uniref:zinc dependent phospholipase C family protein n=1 Tax=Mucilaginibacter pedocola TaxID=1792845 RepID=UPI00138FB5C4|nr:zinc dependent phospholipase C family protein [Mucilaginibacter pedocola]